MTMRPGRLPESDPLEQLARAELHRGTTTQPPAYDTTLNRLHRPVTPDEARAIVGLAPSPPPRKPRRWT